MQPRRVIFAVLLPALLVLTANGCNESPITAPDDSGGITGPSSQASGATVNCRKDKTLEQPAQIQSAVVESPMRIHLLSVAGSDRYSGYVRINWYELQDESGVITYVPSGLYNGDTKDLLDIRVEGLRPSGRYSVKLYSSDACGNAGYSATKTLVMPSLAPETTRPVVSTPVATYYGTFMPVRVVEVRASDDTGVSRIEYYFNGTLKYTASLQTYIHWWLSSQSPTYRWTIPSDLRGKAGVVSVKVFDALNNVTETAALLTL
jgi:hypothetical protein